MNRSVLSRAVRNVPCILEAIEQRRMMSVALANGTLTITGTAGNDNISVEPYNGQLRVNDNGRITNFNLSAVTQILASLGDGNDKYTSAWYTAKPQTVSGGNGNDTVAGGYSNDQLFGNEGNDVIRGHEGADLISGGNGYDEVTYSGMQRSISVTLDNVANDGANAGYFTSVEFDNVLSDVEGIWGSDYDDYLSGSSADNRIYGMSGNDYIVGGAGNDGLFGYHGNDTVMGMEGNDWMWGENGADLIVGGAGIDDVRYDEGGRTGGVLATLAVPGMYTLSYYNGAAGENDRIRGDVENLVGSRFNDHLVGNSANNGIHGLDGNDFISAGAGNDWVNGNAGNDRLYGDGGNDFVWGEQGADGMSGGEGWDDVRYDDAWHNSRGFGVNARLSNWFDPSKLGNGVAGENDYIAEDFEALIGTNYGDILSGNEQNNYLAGLDGDDMISGKGGHDTLDAGKGADRVWGDAGNDTLFGKDGSIFDTLDGGEGWDTVERDVSRFSIFLFQGPRRDAVYNAEVIR
jgi:Ca2+-binding RTX toxin-like protein